MGYGINKIKMHFENIRESDEKILWAGTPIFLPFLLKGIPFLVLGILWGLMDYQFFIKKQDLDLGISIFTLLHTMPLWLSILNILRLVLVFPNTCYAYSNKRILLRSGFWGIDYKTIDFDKISDIEVTVNPIEALFGAGTIKAFSGRSDNDGKSLTDDMISIFMPYEVFKRIKKVSVDVKTDWNYPNALRPDVNPGYKTRYNPDTDD